LSYSLSEAEPVSIFGTGFVLYMGVTHLLM